MLDSIAISLGGVAGTNSNVENSRNSLQETYSQFLTLLTTQMKNQDPLNPMDSKDFTNQLISLASAEQQISQTQKMDEILKVNQASAVNASLSYIGKEVDYVGGDMEYKGNPVKLKYFLDADAKNTKISIFDKDDKLVWTTNGEVGVGGHDLTWDGKDASGLPVANGSYKVEVGAVDKEDKSIKTFAIVPSTVSGIEAADGQVLLVIGKKKVAIGSVQAVRNPS